VSWERRYARALVATDVAAVGIAIVITSSMGIRPSAGDLWPGAGGVDGVVVALALVAVWMASMAFTGAYEPKAVGVGSDEYRRLTGGALAALATSTSLAFTLEAAVSRPFLFTTIPIAFVAAGVFRQISRKQLHRRRAAGRFTYRVLIAGGAASVADLVRHFRRAPFAGYTVVAACVPDATDVLAVDGVGIPVAGTPEDVLRAIAATRADTLAVADSSTFPGAALRSLAWQLEGTGVDLIVAPAVTEVAGPRISVRPVAGVPLLHVEEPSLSGPARFAKSAFDRAFAITGLVVLSPLLLTIALLVRLTSPGPALFRQTRVGRDGREFRMLKFRTMIVGAQEQIEDLRPLVPDPGHVLFKLPDDPRLTRIGRWLRRHSLDELPQLWNVLVGDMSVVGPRPPLPEEVARYEDHAHRRLVVKPGLTGLWQVSGRADLSWDDAVRLDLYYVENWSWVLDALILARTVPAVLKGRGAY